MQFEFYYGDLWGFGGENIAILPFRLVALSPNLADDFEVIINDAIKDMVIYE